ncbi:MAG TPA: redoxin domain-containing protein [Bryobacteraceae bacterium]|nr:redoxin domain-containing protein [Bryobacteraceae bacterium]
MKISRILMGLAPAVAMVLTMSHPVVRAADTVPAVGSVAPDFTLSSQEGKKVSLHDYRGQWVVLYFYPKDMTPGCTIEAHNFQRDQKLYDAKKTAILGVSVDSVDSHVQFCTKENLTFKLLSDPDKKVVNEYGSTQKFGQNVVAARNTFLIDPKGVIRKVFTKVNPTPHSAEVLAALDELKKG